jgi:4-hydroxybenzoate polyprenyltransferase
MLAFLKLIRWPNLLIMAFTQYMVRHFLLAPFLELQRADEPLSLWDMEMAMSGLDFFLLVLSTVMIGAAGYIINDYFDIRIDEVNRPATNMVGKGIKRRVAMAAHMTLNILGAAIGIWLSWKYNQFRVGSFLYITAPALLWFYSTNLKRQFFIGNFVIALLSGLVPLVVALFELPNIRANFPDAQGNYLHVVFQATLILSLFAFIVSLLREIIKDTEDYEGDMTYGCKTLPIVLGIARAKQVIVVIAAVVVALIGWLQYKQMEAEDWAGFMYLAIMLQAPLVYLGYRVMTAKGKKDWRFASTLVKLIMVAGISYLFLYAHQVRALITADVS